MRTEKRALVVQIIAVVLVAILLIGLIVGTVLLETNEHKEWEYHTDELYVDYYANDGSNAFQYATSLKNSIITYFGTAVNKYVDISSLLTPFADSIIQAMGEARIPAIKLKYMAENLNAESLFGIFDGWKEIFSQYDNVEDLTNGLAIALSKVGIINMLSNGVSSFLDGSALTEDEFARFIYRFLINNTKEDYVQYLNLFGEDYFIKLFSNTIYVLDTLNTMNKSNYQLQSTAYSLQQICYQMGSLYTGISAVTGGTETFERVLWWTWDYDVSTSIGAECQELSDSLRGKAGDIFLIIGRFLQELTVQDIETFLSIPKIETQDIRLICDYNIYSASITSKIIYEKINQALPKMGKNYDTLEELLLEYVTVSEKYSQLTELVLSQLETEENNQSDETMENDMSEMVQDILDGFEYMLDFNMTLEEIQALDGESEEYDVILEHANNTTALQTCITKIFSDVLCVMSVNKLISISEETK